MWQTSGGRKVPLQRCGKQNEGGEERERERMNGGRVWGDRGDRVIIATHQIW